MFKRLILGAAVIGGVAYFVKKKLGGGYDEDDIDAGDWSDFSDHGAAPAATAPATTAASTSSQSPAAEAEPHVPGDSEPAASSQPEAESGHEPAPKSTEGTA